MEYMQKSNQFKNFQIISFIPYSAKQRSAIRHDQRKQVRNHLAYVRAKMTV